MLIALGLQNFALVEKAHIQFTPGLNVLTGETGAGKSILLDALGLCLGKRASNEYVRSGSVSAKVSALFDVTNHFALGTVLDTLDIPLENDGSLLVEREISIEGKNICRLNGQLTTVGILRQCGILLVDVYSQHEHSQLLHEDFQRDLLDGFGDNDLQEIKGALANELIRRQELNKELDRLGGDEQLLARELDMLRFQTEEIAAAQLNNDEEEHLLAERDKLRNIARIEQFVALAETMLLNIDGKNLLDSLGEIVQQSQELSQLDTDLVPLADILSNAFYLLEDAQRYLMLYQDGLDIDPSRLEQVDDRLYLISTLKRKYGDTITEVLAFYEQALASIDFLENSEEHRKTLLKQIANCEAQYRKLAQKLSMCRVVEGKKLAQQMAPDLRSLGMPHATIEFDITHDPKTFSYNGSDKVEILFSANKGEPLYPLVKVASGGELSRLMLAIKATAVQGNDQGPPCLIFDEIDAGIGGQIAKAVADKLAMLSKKRQILCVTHLATVAARGDSHYQVDKKELDTRTVTEIRQLSDQERLGEISRMLGGSVDETATREHAALLLKKNTSDFN